MILVDTSVWVEHFRTGNSLAAVLAEGLVLTHPFVIGELACGNLRNRSKILVDLAALTRAATAADEEVMQLVEQHRLWVRGIGWIDAHLIASALITNCRLWTLDQPLKRAAAAAGVKPYIPV
jgi:predicted nucleic acid-binding protein